MPKLTFGPADGLDIEAYRGDDFQVYLQIKRNSIPENLSTSTFLMQIRSGQTLINQISSSASPTEDGRITVESFDGGVLILTIPRGRMLELPAGNFSYDIEQTYPDGIIKTRVRGIFSIRDDVTKPS